MECELQIDCRFKCNYCTQHFSHKRFSISTAHKNFKTVSNLIQIMIIKTTIQTCCKAGGRVGTKPETGMV